MPLASENGREEATIMTSRDTILEELLFNLGLHGCGAVLQAAA